MTELKKVLLEDKVVLSHLLNLYLHDLSEYSDDLETNKEGIYEYDALDAFFDEEKLHPYFIVEENKAIGFILLSEAPYAKPGTDYCIQEIFILKNKRHKGRVRRALEALFQIHKGKYSIFILKNNEPAVNFWRGFLNDLNYDEGDETHPHYENCVYLIFDVK